MSKLYMAYDLVADEPLFVGDIREMMAYTKMRKDSIYRKVWRTKTGLAKRTAMYSFTEEDDE